MVLQRLHASALPLLRAYQITQGYRYIPIMPTDQSNANLRYDMMIMVMPDDPHVLPR